MNDIQRLTAQPPISRSTTYERSQNVQLTSSVRREGNVSTETTIKTTINELKEITKTREELESLALQQNQQSTEKEKDAATAASTSPQLPQPTAKPTDTDVPVSLEVIKDYRTSLAKASKSQNGGLFNATV